MSDQQKKQKSLVRKEVERRAKQQAKKIAGKALKKGAKLAAKAIAKGVAALAKMLVTLLGAVSTPVLIAVGIAILVIIVVSLVLSFSFGKGEDLSGDEQEIYDYIVQQANNTVNMDDPVQSEFRVPEELISSVIQMDILYDDHDEKDIIKNMANDLAPTFIYGSFNEWTQTKKQVCIDDECEEWSDIEQTDNFVDKITEVIHWKGYTEFEHEPYTTAWASTKEYETLIVMELVEELQVRYETKVITTMVEEEYTEIINVPYTIIEKIIIPVPVDFPPYVIYLEQEIEKEVCCREEEVTKTRWVEKEEEIQVPVWEVVAVEKEVEKEKVTTTKTRYQRFVTHRNDIEDYSTFDSMLNEYNLGINDKKLIEVNYLFQEQEMNYIDWIGSNISSVMPGYFDGTITPGESVPTQYMEYYLGAEKEYGVDWSVLAAIHFVETSFSTHGTMISSAGAIGHMQFMPATWVGWAFDIGGGMVDEDLDITDLSIIAEGRGYGVDGNGDGIADPWNEADAIYSAANYLAKSGFHSDKRGAIFNYNHADWYVDKVIIHANKFQAEAVYMPADVPPISDGSFTRPSTGYVTSGYGYRDDPENKSITNFHHGIDIGSGGKNVPIIAAADGEVIVSKNSGSYGNYVIVKHTIDGEPFETLYAHMQKRAVNVGDTVKKGQLLGLMGRTGRATGIHLHFEIHSPSWNGQRTNSINPAYYIDFSN